VVFQREHFQVAFSLAYDLPLRYCLTAFVWRFHGRWRDGSRAGQAAPPGTERRAVQRLAAGRARFGGLVRAAGFCGGFPGPNIRVCRQVRLVGNVPCFAPLKNDKIHDVPSSDELAPVLAEHIRQYPAAAVTLPWEKPGGEPVTFRLLVTTAAGRALHRSRFNTLC